MSQSHNMSVAEYEMNLSNRMKVEKRREEEYQESKNIEALIDKQIIK